VVASNHHRANLAIRDVMLAFLSGETQAHRIVAAHGATLLVVCTGMAEPGNYLRDAPRGLMADITAGRIPPWLKPVTLGQPASLKVFRVINRP
jgi:hypothetical protein